MQSERRWGDAAVLRPVTRRLVGPVTPVVTEGFHYGGGPELGDVEDLMLRAADGDHLERAGQMVREHLSTGGKRIRARLALSTLEMLSRHPAEGVAWAAACELLHNATLIHDDVQDGDHLRRGRATVWVRHGIPQAINAGDLLHALSMRVIAEVEAPAPVKWQLCLALARGAEQAVRGQTLEMDLLASGRTDWESWSRAAEGKTGALFGLPVEGAALIADLEPETAARLAMPFRKMGVLFQIEDDLLDVFDAKGRNGAGNDLREGKVSALVVEHLHAVPEDREWMLNLLALPRERTPDHLVREALQKFRERGAVDALLQRMEDLSESIANDLAWRTCPDMLPMAHALMRVAHAAVNQATSRISPRG